MAGPTNTQFSVAVHVLTYLAGMPHDAVSSDQLAGSTGTNAVYVRRVLGRLRDAGVVVSRPGPGGGWQLEHAPAEITLGDVWRVVQEGSTIFGLHAVEPACPVGASIAATLTELDTRLTQSVEAELDRTTVADVMPVGALPEARAAAARA
ncbi:MAG: Rrf2 family transcriptional regulator [Solirubrobacteraceae bacterium]|nr:Rrf2 family transcriptional regulator [Patulibacter sp.]